MEDSFNLLEKNLDIIFGSPVFGSLVGIISLVYAYYLYRKSIGKHKLMIMTMTNHEENSHRCTNMLIYNDGNSDITNSMFVNNDGLTIHPNENIVIEDISIESVPDRFNKYEINEIVKNKSFQIKFDILRSKKGILVKIVHNSDSFMDVVWNELEIVGTLPNIEIVRDDFSDQMIYYNSPRK